MADIRLRFACEDGLPSHLIEFYGHGHWSHVDVVMNDGLLLGARIKGGVAIRPADYGHFIRTSEIRLPCDDATAARYMALVTAELGKPYDTVGIVGFAAGRDWRSDSSWFCSELAGRML